MNASNTGRATGDRLIKSRPGGWLPHDRAAIGRWIRGLRQHVSNNPVPWVPPIVDFMDMVKANPLLYNLANQMFTEAYIYQQFDPLDQLAVMSFFEFLQLLNAVMTTAPECFENTQTIPVSASGLIGFPINALLDWPMATQSGYAFFSQIEVNYHLKKILQYWSVFLSTSESRYVLTQPVSRLNPDTEIVPWLGDVSQTQMVKVAAAALGDGPNPTPSSFVDIFNCHPLQPYCGFASWDDFFTRTFKPGVRPISSVGDDSVIVNACESAPLQVISNVALDAQFWLKGQPYSLQNMLNHDPDIALFVGGTVYQAFLSAQSYHRWHSPVSGTVTKVCVVDGSYYLENLFQGFLSPKPDSSAPNNSQPFLTAVATRALIFIQANNPKIGLMCMVAVGMAEVSSCDVTVAAGQAVTKGDQLGMFHFGGSTHCLVFRRGVNPIFDFYGEIPGLNAASNIRVNTKIATVK